ncbi:MAG: inositol monophosphatase [Sedimentisphaerales bacterium]|nr:inositol monophosphatase [Sedimentisphaerales bacterium]
MKEFLTAARSIVRQAGAKAQKRVFGAEVLREKPSGDLGTSADEGIEDFVSDSLGKRFPNHGFDGEERGRRRAGRSGYVWVLDPIDGTKYYVKHMPFYSVSLALEHRGTPIIGVVYAPELALMYCAASGGGATLNGRTIRCSKDDELTRVSMWLELPSRDSRRRDLRWAMTKMAILVKNTHRVRILGVGSLSLCFCASGSFDVYVNLGSALKRCDVAAGRVILEEAGGQYWSFGEKNNRVIAGPEGLCTQIRELLGL